MITLDTETLSSDLKAFMDSFEAAADAEAVDILVEMAAAARDELRDLDDRAGHDALATMWTYDVGPTEDGAEAEVYSGAENVTFFNRTSSQAGGRIQSSLYPIEGLRLLAILEGGAAEHDIFPGTINENARALTIPIPGSEERSKALLRQHGPTPLDPGDTIFRSAVHHPGVAAENHVAMTTEQMLLTLDAHYLKAVGLNRDAIRATAGLSGPYDFEPYAEDRPIFNMRPGDKNPNPDIEPVNFADGHAPPLLLIQGGRDEVVRPDNATELEGKICKAGGQARVVIYPDRAHEGTVIALAAPYRWLAPVLRDAAEFFREH